MKKLLHAGCGGSPLPGWFGDQYAETRLDIDPDFKPDIVASLTDMRAIEDGAFDIVYTSHCVEHLYPAEVGTALAEFRRVTAPGGAVIVIVPDLEGVQVSDEPLLDAGVGTLSGLDLIYGCRYDAHRSQFMAHHSGFTSGLLARAMRDAGFEDVTMKRLPEYNLMGVARVPSA